MNRLQLIELAFKDQYLSKLQIELEIGTARVNGISLDAQDSNGNTALIKAANKCHLSCQHKPC